jgi:hypothetical protein
MAPADRFLQLASTAYESKVKKFGRKDINFTFAIPKLNRNTQRSGRAVYCTGLENRRPFTGSGGSNPSSSASCNKIPHQRDFLLAAIYGKTQLLPMTELWAKVKIASVGFTGINPTFAQLSTLCTNEI